ncbi:MAG: hypothetical protein ACP5I1_11600 [Candidatus Hinthialibacter sp.]
MDLPLDPDLQTPESILQWIGELNVRLDIRQLNSYPARPLVFSDYILEPPAIVIYRYLPMEDWLNLMCQRSVGYYGPWYFLPITHRLYYHLELNGLFEIERKWHHRCFGRLETLEDRAHRFVKEILGLLSHPSKFDVQVNRAFQPGVHQV